MKVETSRGILTDTGFWIALFDKTDDHHLEAIRIIDRIEQVQILFPWPIFYEVLRTRFVRRPIWIERFSREIRSPRIIRFDDKPYREDALQQTLEWARMGHRHISLVDMVVRYILIDTKIKITGLITYNEKDFLDICKKRKIPINL